ncbi:membrane protein [Murid herpesvirus 3]|uniref:Membrane protein n=2 Tax=Murid betaherpesvirus 3 TaxID=2560603 RepID=A0A1P8VIS6_9BETA|nr:membrane protein [Murine roseolovirus]APZ76248.1 membrane protein [Murid betaherpesvirus 3]AYH64736.1 membrane protein [Murid herpesvirus 3]
MLAILFLYIISTDAVLYPKNCPKYETYNSNGYRASTGYIARLQNDVFKLCSDQSLQVITSFLIGEYLVLQDNGKNMRLSDMGVFITEVCFDILPNIRRLHTEFKNNITSYTNDTVKCGYDEDARYLFGVSYTCGTPMKKVEITKAFPDMEFPHRPHLIERYNIWNGSFRAKPGRVETEGGELIALYDFNGESNSKLKNFISEFIKDINNECDDEVIQFSNLLNYFNNKSTKHDVQDFNSIREISSISFSKSVGYLNCEIYGTDDLIYCKMNGMVSSRIGKIIIMEKRSTYGRNMWVSVVPNSSGAFSDPYGINGYKWILVKRNENSYGYKCLCSLYGSEHVMEVELPMGSNSLETREAVKQLDISKSVTEIIVLILFFCIILLVVTFLLFCSVFGKSKIFTFLSDYILNFYKRQNKEKYLDITENQDTSVKAKYGKEDHVYGDVADLRV